MQLIVWLVVLSILKNMSSSMGRIIPYIYIYIMEKTCLKHFETTKPVVLLVPVDWIGSVAHEFRGAFPWLHLR